MKAKKATAFLMAFLMAFISLAITPLEAMPTPPPEVWEATDNPWHESHVVIGNDGDNHRDNLRAMHEEERTRIMEERLAREVAELDILTSTLGNPIGMVGFEGAYMLDNFDETIEIIVQFVTPPTVALHHMRERGVPLGRSLPGQSYEEQALSAHTAFHQQLMGIPVPFSSAGFEIFGEHHQLFNGVYMRVPSGMVEAVASLPEVYAVFPDVRISIDPRIDGITPTASLAPVFPHNNAARELFNIDYIHNVLGFTGAGVRVAVLDTGVNYNHPDLIRYRDSATGRIRGQNFVHGVTTGIMDFHGHGTHVSGAVVALAPDVELWHYRVADSQGFGQNSWFIDAITQAWVDNIDIINLSFGGDWTDINNPVNHVFNLVTLDGVITTISAGNFQLTSTRPQSIGSLGTASLPIVVGAGTAGGIWDIGDTIADFSSRGAVPGTYHIKPDIIAPGVGNHTTSLGYGYAISDGTSMAAPAVAGIAALMLNAFPNAEPYEIKSRLMNTARPLADLSPNDDSVFTVGAGFIQPIEALTSTAFATVTHEVPWGTTTGVFQSHTMSSLSFGIAYGGTSNSIPIIIHNPGAGTWTPQVVFNGNHAGVGLNITPSGGSNFTAQMTFASGTNYGLYEGNLVFTNGSQRITMPFAANFTSPPIDITSSFTDPNFLAAVRSNLGLSPSQPIFTTDVERVTSLWAGYWDINSLNGIEHFTALTRLSVSGNNLTTLDLSNNPHLEVLWTYSNNLTSLNVSNNPALIELDVWDNYLTSLDVSNNPNLAWLIASRNNMTSLNDVTGWQQLGLIEGDWDSFAFWPQRGVTPSNLTVSVNNAAMGGADFSSQLWSDGTFIGIFAWPNAGYIFDRWEIIFGSLTLDANQVNSSWLEFDGALFNVPIEIRAHFMPMTGAVTIATSVNDSAMGGVWVPQSVVEPGQMVSFSISASAGYAIRRFHFIDATNQAIWVPLERTQWSPIFQEYQFVANENITIVVEFVSESSLFSVSVENDFEFGVAWVATAWSEWLLQSVPAVSGNSVSISATAEGFDRWEVIYGDATIINHSYNDGFVFASFIMPNENVRIRAVFDDDNFGVAPTITDHNAPNGMVSIPYGADGLGFTFEATSLTSWSLTGVLPPGLTFNPLTGTISGTPTQPGTFSGLTVRAANMYGYDESTFTIVIAPFVPTWSVSLTPPGNIDFGRIPVSGTPPSARQITITNTGNQATGALNVSLTSGDVNSFALEGNTNITNLNVFTPGNTAAFTIAPIVTATTTPGALAATIAVTGDNGISETINVNFEAYVPTVIQQLPAPTGLQIHGSTLTWNTVSGAVGYRVYADGFPVSGTVTSLNFNLANVGLAAGTRLIQVRALGNGTTTSNSVLSSGVNFFVHGWWQPGQPEQPGDSWWTTSSQPSTAAPPPPSPIRVNINGVSVIISQSGGNVTLNLTTANITQIIDNADDSIRINLASRSNATSATLPIEAVSHFADAGLGLEFVFPHATFNISNAAVRNIADQAQGSNVQFAVQSWGLAQVPAEVQTVIPTGSDIWYITVSSDGTNLSNINGEMTTRVSFVGTPPAVAWRLNTAGQLELLQSTFNPQTATITLFKYDLSIFVVGTDPSANQISATEVAATLDVELPSQLMRLSIGSVVYTHLGSVRQIDVAPYIDPVYNRTMVPLRIIAESLGAEVHFEDSIRTVFIRRNGVETHLTIGYPLPNQMGMAVIVNDRTFVPLRYIAEILGAEVRWDEAALAVYIYN